jgi:hypothetical protein
MDDGLSSRRISSSSNSLICGVRSTLLHSNVASSNFRVVAKHHVHALALALAWYRGAGVLAYVEGDGSEREAVHSACRNVCVGNRHPPSSVFCLGVSEKKNLVN